MATFKGLENTFYAIPKAQILWKPVGADSYTVLGDADDVNIETAVEETERYTNEEGLRIKSRTIVTQIDLTLSMTLVQLTDTNRALSLLGEVTPFTQAAAADEVKNIAGVNHNDAVYQLDHRFIDGASVVITDGATTVNYVEGTHYRVDAEGGFIQFIAEPDGADGDAVITYDVLEITADDGKNLIGPASKSANRGSIIIRGQNDVGPRVMVELWDVQLRPAGERSYISETDLDTIELEGDIFRDPTKPAGFELGQETLIALEGE